MDSIQFGNFVIQSPNSSGQGYCYFNHEFLPILAKWGYNYSHSTVIKGGNYIPDMICHTFFNERNDSMAGKRRAISIHHYADGGDSIYFRSNILGSGRECESFGAENLNSHLKCVERISRRVNKKEGR